MFLNFFTFWMLFLGVKKHRCPQSSPFIIRSNVQLSHIIIHTLHHLTSHDTALALPTHLRLSPRTPYFTYSSPLLPTFHTFNPFPFHKSIKREHSKSRSNPKTQPRGYKVERTGSPIPSAQYIPRNINQSNPYTPSTTRSQRASSVSERCGEGWVWPHLFLSSMAELARPERLVRKDGCSFARSGETGWLRERHRLTSCWVGRGCHIHCLLATQLRENRAKRVM